jgi:hypothetical protein
VKSLVTDASINAVAIGGRTLETLHWGGVPEALLENTKDWRPWPAADPAGDPAAALAFRDVD